MNTRGLGETQIDRIAAEYMAGGVTMVALARKYGVSDFSIRALLAQAGVKPTRRSYTRDQLEAARALREEGRSFSSISKDMKLPESTVRLMLAQR